MGNANSLINIEEARKVFCGNDSIKKRSYAITIEICIHNIGDKLAKNLQEIMELLIECVITEIDEDVKEEMYMALRNMVMLNEYKYVKGEVERLVTKIGLLKNRDLAEAIYIISETYDARYIKLFERYITYPYDEVQDAAKEAIRDIKYAENMKRKLRKALIQGLYQIIRIRK